MIDLVFSLRAKLAVPSERLPGFVEGAARVLRLMTDKNPPPRTEAGQDLNRALWVRLNALPQNYAHRLEEEDSPLTFKKRSAPFEHPGLCRQISRRIGWFASFEALLRTPRVPESRVCSGVLVGLKPCAKTYRLGLTVNTLWINWTNI